MKRLLEHPAVKPVFDHPVSRQILPLIPWRFVKFGIVGTGGYLTDVFVLTGLTKTGMSKYVGQVIAFVVASAFTWMANRFWTFSDRKGHSHPAAEWLRYLAVTAMGFSINYLAFWLTTRAGGIWAQYLFLPVAAGSIAGLLWNFPMSRFVFKRASSGLQEGPASFSGP